jgi:murein tripeptide amidase MpaA
LGGLDIPIVKVVNKISIDNKRRPVIVIVGRQHPGITYSSFVIHGIINYLLSDEIISDKLRADYEIWVVPMLNPDGVVLGNYKNNLQGRDINRRYYADFDEQSLNNRAFESEILRNYLKKQFPQNEKDRFLMFFDIQIECHETSIYLRGVQTD